MTFYNETVLIELAAILKYVFTHAALDVYVQVQHRLQISG